MKKNSYILVAIAAVIIVIAVFYTNNEVKSKPDQVKTYELLMENNFDLDYPDSPYNVIKKNDEILLYMYSNEITEEQVASVVALQRKLFSEALLEFNQEIMQVQSVKNDIKSNKENELWLVTVDTLQTEYNKKEGISCNIKSTQSYSRTAKIYRTYTLIFENDKWKIYNWSDSSTGFVNPK